MSTLARLGVPVALVTGTVAQPPGFRAENVVQGLNLASAMACDGDSGRSISS